MDEAIKSRIKALKDHAERTMKRQSLTALACHCIDGESMTALDAKRVLAIMAEMEREVATLKRLRQPASETLDPSDA